MSQPGVQTRAPILRGMTLIARGRAEGLNCFRDTPRAFLASLAPGAGLLTAAVLAGLSEGEGGRAAAEIPGTLCVLLAPSVLSYELARFWGREAFWYRYIVAFNWCQWLLPLIGMALVLGMTVVRASGMGGPGGFKLLVLGLAGYALWMNWFLARHGLALTAMRAAAFVLLVNLGTMALVFIPGMLASIPR